ncbi:XRE family transcriptional regulator [Collinsella intestinalis]|uniref:XRE family transcriptional regulator n=1 Tax=Collinsella intestinalis TaxID=147207 RepID=UPI0025A3C5E9|nr:XRE family transcriptional regulator [Collinsella intestinalis]MDM8163904.1 XRE family transcriptional regulator [Collinsella intestinalis]
MAETGDGRRDGEPLTEELLAELLAAPDPAVFADAHDLAHRDLATYLNELLLAKGRRRVEAVRAAELNETFGYQIFKGQRGAGRDTVLRLAIALGCDLVETRRLLQAAGVNELYCKDRRDAIIIFCIDRGYSLRRVDDELYRLGERTLGE